MTVMPTAVCNVSKAESAGVFLVVVRDHCNAQFAWPRREHQGSVDRTADRVRQFGRHVTSGSSASTARCR